MVFRLVLYADGSNPIEVVVFPPLGDPPRPFWLPLNPVESPEVAFGGGFLSGRLTPPGSVAKPVEFVGVLARPLFPPPVGGGELLAVFDAPGKLFRSLSLRLLLGAVDGVWLSRDHGSVVGLASAVGVVPVIQELSRGALGSVVGPPGRGVARPG